MNYAAFYLIWSHFQNCEDKADFFPYEIYSILLFIPFS
ncbi:hypothetical protein LEP1GSC125_0722 [Leptospira mayottensis 200901122]|uniref:Uncharacterized protein n=1 Tax=Leptospira mayottensis 200901122 TaxID=1193010 RepID=A0AA87MTD0_9LEPT|nr:hypothetical protein LEP1GSC125_0722 [Leptospira mayottensis 200901122]